MKTNRVSGEAQRSCRQQVWHCFHCLHTLLLLKLPSDYLSGGVNHSDNTNSGPSGYLHRLPMSRGLTPSNIQLILAQHLSPSVSHASFVGTKSDTQSTRQCSRGGHEAAAGAAAPSHSAVPRITSMVWLMEATPDDSTNHQLAAARQVPLRPFLPLLLPTLLFSEMLCSLRTYVFQKLQRLFPRL